jgi:hypothetical protein
MSNCSGKSSFHSHDPSLNSAKGTPSVHVNP